MSRLLRSYNQRAPLTGVSVIIPTPPQAVSHGKKTVSRARLGPCRFQDPTRAIQEAASARKPTDYNTAHDGVTYITCEELHSNLDAYAYILDVQSKENYVCTGHVPSQACKNIPVHEFMSLTKARVDELLQHKDKPVVVLSNRGRTAASVQMLLTRALGFKDVRALEGGMQAWRDKGLPIKHGTDCAIINAHCPWIDNNDLLCSLQINNHGAGAESEPSDIEVSMFP